MDFFSLLLRESRFEVKELPLVKREPIFDTFGTLWGYELLIGNGVVFGDREKFFDNLNEVLDFIFFQTHLESFDPSERGYYFINVKPKTLMLFGDRIAQMVPTNAVLEIREDSVGNSCLLKIREFKERTGIKICVDDFGTGGSNLERLVLLKPDFVKIDMKVLSFLPYACRKKALKDVTSLVRETTQAQIIFEKVENPEDLQIAKEVGVTLWQGYLSRVFGSV